MRRGQPRDADQDARRATPLGAPLESVFRMELRAGVGDACVSFFPATPDGDGRRGSLRLFNARPPGADRSTGSAGSAQTLADHHVELGARAGRRPASTFQPSVAEVVGEARRACAGRAPSSSSARTSRPLVALLKWLTTCAPAVDLVQHPHGDHPAGEVGRRPPERGVRRGAQVDHQPAAGAPRGRPGRGASRQCAGDGAEPGQGDVAGEPVGRDPVAGRGPARTATRSPPAGPVARRRAAASRRGEVEGVVEHAAVDRVGRARSARSRRPALRATSRRPGSGPSPSTAAAASGSPRHSATSASSTCARGVGEPGRPACRGRAACRGAGRSCPRSAAAGSARAGQGWGDAAGSALARRAAPRDPCRRLGVDVPRATARERSAQRRHTRVGGMSSSRVVRVHAGDEVASRQSLRDGIATIQSELEVTPEFPPEVEEAAARGGGRARGCPTSTAPTSRSSPSTRRRRWTSTRRCTSSATATATSCTTRSPTSRRSSRRATRSTSRRNRRGETLYGADSKVPLHPTVLSEGAASLLPDQVRPALLWTIKVDADRRGHRRRTSSGPGCGRPPSSTTPACSRPIDDGTRRRDAACCSRRSASCGSRARPPAAASRCRCPSRRSTIDGRPLVAGVPRADARSRSGTPRSRCSPASPRRP